MDVLTEPIEAIVTDPPTMPLPDAVAYFVIGGEPVLIDMTAPIFDGILVCDTCNGSGRLDWLPGQVPHLDEEQQPCPDCVDGIVR